MKRPIHSTVPFILIVLSGVLSASAQTASRPQVGITGGVDETARNYTWIITHEHSSPLVRVVIPHYRASVFTAPEGWTGALTERLGTHGRAGTLTIVADDQKRALVRGRSLEVTLSVIAEGTPRGQREVTLAFADGVETKVVVEVPIKEPLSDRSVSLIGLGVIFAIFWIVRALKHKPSQAEPSTDSDSPPPR
ncbi:MAG: hypothetical protein JSU63_04640 [Phycisphaerales bacterium]|nr:MAG: hypothetical protein JSU63_04640 [Phycisphaerales bacterium]